jgi:threonine synthase
VYYFLSYFAIRRALPTNTNPELQFIVPTGNFGDILAGYYAKRMGLPMGKLVIATNANDILTRFWRTGRYEKVDSSLIPDSPSAIGGVVETLSPAMDILVSSNFERLLWYLAFENAQNTNPGVGDLRETACQTVKDWMDKVKSVGRIVVPDSVLELARKDFTAERVDDDQVRSYIYISQRELISHCTRADPPDDSGVLHLPIQIIYCRPTHCSRAARCRRPHAPTRYHPNCPFHRAPGKVLRSGLERAGWRARVRL